MQQQIKGLGIIAIVLGSAAALLCLFPKQLIIALPIGFMGMICSGVYVFIDTRNEINKKKITPGIIGMLLSSMPVLLILIFIILSRFKN
jgi:hypothetical protein